MGSPLMAPTSWGCNGCVFGHPRLSDALLRRKGHIFFAHFLNFNLISLLQSMLFCTSFRGTAQWLDNHIVYRVAPWYFQSPFGTMHSYRNIIDYIPCAVLSIPWPFWNDSLYFWISSPFSPLHQHSPSSATTSNHQSLLCICESVSVVSLFCSLDSTYKWNHMVFIFLWLTYFT